MLIVHLIVVALKLPRHVPDLIRYARAVVAALTGNHDLPAPTPPLATVTAQIDALEAAELVIKTRVRGAVQDRNAKLKLLVKSLKLLGAYVQDVANAEPDRGETIVTNAQMQVTKRTTRIKADLAAKPGTAPGSLILIAKSAGKKALYEWQMSQDQKTWTSLPSTVVAQTTVNGLTSGQILAFRVRSATTQVQSDWSSVITHVVS